MPERARVLPSTPVRRAFPAGLLVGRTGRRVGWLRPPRSNLLPQAGPAGRAATGRVLDRLGRCLGRSVQAYLRAKERKKGKERTAGKYGGMRRRSVCRAEIEGTIDGYRNRRWRKLRLARAVTVWAARSCGPVDDGRRSGSEVANNLKSRRSKSDAGASSTQSTPRAVTLWARGPARGETVEGGARRRAQAQHSRLLVLRHCEQAWSAAR